MQLDDALRLSTAYLTADIKRDGHACTEYSYNERLIEAVLLLAYEQRKTNEALDTLCVILQDKGG